MAIRDRWNRMRSAAATSTTYTSPSSSPVSSPVSAPTSPGVWGTITGFNWSPSRTTTGSSSNASTEAGGTSSDEHHHQQQQQQQQQQQSQQQRQYQQQSPRAKITFTLPARPKAPKSSSSSSSRRFRPHPSERPLTEENLAYQQVFANYTLTFGSSRCSLDGDVSPCSSRRGSLDMPPV
ncbi:hypothetical protein GGTG_10053 [Gaeumannomyces tritici R3-111a-1]|uniref:Uncharacterized protein n=1 Tax=Gaeumannomyces tritici (strain R3-111a-1) TaxID=644352 RepID=J3P968_GAET3|nr:hypothetical protein GGTG_10053 [Gaeumannomyces tritici R3-111a-1]EJT73204.1 hypothetical protein GGTG_10053 [Gaeumannomyces tritici R3-111a-1]